jgi:pimeloyl-ACP methyl ester carboxylesterase
MAGLEFGPKERPVDIVWSHANGFNARTYRRILAAVGETRRVLAIDLRGHGGSTLPARLQGRESWQEFADDLLALLAALDVRDVVLAGHSLGATTSLLAAVSDAAPVRKLILFEPVLLAPPHVSGGVPAGRADPSRLEQGALKRRRAFGSRLEVEASYRGRGAFRTWPDDMLSDYIADGFHDCPDGSVTLACTPEWEASNFGLSRGIGAADLIDRCPLETLIFRGASDSTCELDRPDGAIGQIAIRSVPETSHFLPMERPDLVASILAQA